MDWLKARYEDEWQHFDARMQALRLSPGIYRLGLLLDDLKACKNRRLDPHFHRFSQIFRHFFSF